MKGESILQMDKPTPSRGQRTQCLPHAAESLSLTKWPYHCLALKPSVAAHSLLPQTQAQCPGLCGPTRTSPPPPPLLDHRSF